jgi:hypothetical protein
LFHMQSVSHHRKVGDYFFPELLLLYRIAFSDYDAICISLNFFCSAAWLHSCT